MATDQSEDAKSQFDTHDICSETLRVEKKVFYLDLKSNSRGTYLKLSEKGANRERSIIAIPSSGIAWFRELFGFYAAELSTGRALRSKELPLETKVFQFDVGRNARGTYLRVSETGPKGRSAVVVPDGLAEGPVEANAWERFRRALEKITDRLPNIEPVNPGAVSGIGTVVGPGPASPALSTTPGGGSVLRVGHKRFYFDLGCNQRGGFLRITEMVGVDRLSIVVPAHAILPFGQAVRLQCERSQQPQNQPAAFNPPSLPQQAGEGLADRFSAIQLRDL